MKEDDRKIADESNSDVANYSIAEEGACSAEFPGGCIECEEQS